MVLEVKAAGRSRDKLGAAIKAAGLASSKAKAEALCVVGTRLGPMSQEDAAVLMESARASGWTLAEAQPLLGGPQVGQTEALPAPALEPAHTVVREETRQLLRDLTPEERTTMGGMVVDLSLRIAEAENRRAEWLAAWKAETAPAVAERQQLLIELAAGQRRDGVQVLHLLSADATEVRVVRTDTGEVLETRTPEGEDRQVRLGGAR
ncbi:MAG: hypothetical protein EBR73_12205 [Rhodobacteraceae bacterium]|nr:hypothetical protein [Paracoccaceae bacterium]